jgi:hypothetical protein
VLSDGAALLSDGVVLVVSPYPPVELVSLGVPIDVVSLGVPIDVVSLGVADVVSAPMPAAVVSPVVTPGACPIVLSV